MADNHWRNTANDVRILSVDARAFSPFPLLLLIKKLFILQLGCVFVIFFFIIEKKFGLDFAKFKRALRARITGPVKTVRRMR